MPNGHYPLLIFPNQVEADRNKRPSGAGRFQKPTLERQRARITPQLAVLQQAFEAKRIQLQQTAPLENPELVLVVEVVGSVEDFANAVSRVPGLEWLFELAEDQIAQDDDFHAMEGEDGDKPLSGRLYLLGTNREALTQLVGLWERYQRDPTVTLDRGLAPFKRVFAQLRAIRPWDVTDRVDEEVRAYWQDQVDFGEATSIFEVEAWHFASAAKNEATRVQIERLVRDQGGLVLSRALIPEIAYHGLLVQVPTTSISNILAGAVPELLLSDRIMFFRPKAQSICSGSEEPEPTAALPERAASEQPPIVALLDGLPLANHALLANRLIIDDPDGWEATYEAKDRVHGTGMASLILHGELDAGDRPLARKLYVRPIMRTEPADTRQRCAEHTPRDTLLIDLVHRAVKRILRGDAGEPAVAPRVRVINLSVGDANRIFSRDVSPWARLIDWLSYEFSVLFVVSAGNDLSPLSLGTPRNSLAGLDPANRQAMSLSALTNESAKRRLLSPAESINAITVGASHSDNAPARVVPNRFNLFADGCVSPFSRVGHGYRRGIKPDILMPGGRVLHMESFGGDPAITPIEPVATSSPPGHKVAFPPRPGESLGETAYSRGTSNAAALASRAAALAYEELEHLRTVATNAPNLDYDAVLLKALLVHGASWGEMSTRLLESRPDLQAIANGTQRRNKQLDLLTRWLGHGLVDIDRGITCASHRATLIGVGALGADEALVFSAPLPPSLAGTTEWRRLTITLAWLSPVSPTNQRYRKARLWIKPPHEVLGVSRSNSVDDKAAQRGTVQHEILDGRQALAYVDGDRFECKVNCAVDAGDFAVPIRFALCVSLEVGVASGISVYDEIRERITPPIPIRPA